MYDVRVLFDALISISKYPSVSYYLCNNSKTVHLPNFENGIVKSMRNAELTDDEKRAISTSDPGQRDNLKPVNDISTFLSRNLLYTKAQKIPKRTRVANFNISSLHPIWQKGCSVSQAMYLETTEAKWILFIWEKHYFCVDRKKI